MQQSRVGEELVARRYRVVRMSRVLRRCQTRSSFLPFFLPRIILISLSASTHGSCLAQRSAERLCIARLCSSAPSRATDSEPRTVTVFHDPHRPAPSDLYARFHLWSPSSSLSRLSPARGNKLDVELELVTRSTLGVDRARGDASRVTAHESHPPLATCLPSLHRSRDM
jgi:hypothetical protein